MTAEYDGNSDTHALKILGISEAEERVYRWLVSHSGATAKEVSLDLSLGADDAMRLLDTIVTRELGTCTSSEPQRYTATSPDIALEHLVREKREDLHRAQDAIGALRKTELLSRQREGREQVVELVIGAEAERRIYDQMHRTAREEIVNMSRPPIIISKLDIPHEQDYAPQSDSMARGVIYRDVYDTRLLNIPGVTERILDEVDAGEQVRISPTVPFKFCIADRRIGIIPLIPENTEDRMVLLIRSSVLLDQFYDLFNIVWEHSTPMSREQASGPNPGDVWSRLPDDAERLIALMAAGLNDKRIADEIGVSATTLKRRISRLMKVFDARTRFQLGRLTNMHAFSNRPDE